MSSLRNAVQRRNHRERAQPEERAKWGLLEKRKDYKLRAADHKTKQRKISALKNKAAERNEDEFYFGMVNASSDGGIKRSKRGEENTGGGGKSLSVDVVKLMKTQDRGYLQTMLQKCRLEREKVERDVVAGEFGVAVQPSESPASGKVVFGRDGEVIVQARPTSGNDEDEHEDGNEDFDMDLADLIDGVDDESDSKEDDEHDKDLTPEERARRRRKRRALDSNRSKLEGLKDQEKKLATALDQLDQQRAKMNGTIGGVNKNGVKFKARQQKR